MKYYIQGRRAFTLVELLVVLAVISILSTLLLPAMARTRIRSGDAGCLSNKRQIMVAWAAYAADNADYMVGNAPGGESPSSGWIDGSFGEESWKSISGNTNAIALKDALLYPYLPGGIPAYRCPANNLPSANGIRLRSISMVGSMGGISQSLAVQSYNHPGVVFFKVSDLTRLTPANAIVFVDESMATLNDGYLQIDTQGSPYFSDVPANYHDGGCGFGYADGHGEIHKWQTVPLIGVPYNPSVGYGGGFIISGVGNQNVDWLWWCQHVDYNP